MFSEPMAFERSRRRRFSSRLRLHPERLEVRRLLATFMVTSVNDSGPGTLREAIFDANAATGSDVIEFDPGLNGRTIELASEELSITDDLVVNASALPEGIVINASGADPTPEMNDGAGIRIFNIDDGEDDLIDVSLLNLTLMGGDVSGEGGAIRSLEMLSLTDSTVTGNAANQGGGLYAYDRFHHGVLVLDIAHTDFVDNSGGGISVRNRSGGNMAIQESIVSGNFGSGISASMDQAGDLEVSRALISGNMGRGFAFGVQYGGTAIIHASTISGNQRGGLSISAGSFGGGAQISDSTITDNRATDDGGGIWFAGYEGSVSIRNSVIGNNTAEGNGGGIWAHAGSSAGLYLENSVISGNQAVTGGGLFAEADAMYSGEHRILNSTFEGNSASASGGGAYFVSRGDSQITVQRSTFAGNVAHRGGGVHAIAEFGFDDDHHAEIEVINTTISGNTSVENGGGVSAYVGVYDPASHITIEHSTISGNLADRDGLYPSNDPGGGLHAKLSVYAGPNPERVKLSHTILANNTRGPMATPDDVAGNIEADFSLFESTSPGADIIGTDNLFGVDPQLGALADNAGPTRTHQLLPGSPAIDAGDANPSHGTARP